MCKKDLSGKNMIFFLFKKTCCLCVRENCWCKKNRDTCPVHVLGGYVRSLPLGSKLFHGINKSNLGKRLKARLMEAGVEEYLEHRSHDFRRGHARDLQASGAPLREILIAGEWRSPAFLQYLDLDTMEHDIVLQAHWAESSDNEN